MDNNQNSFSYTYSAREQSEVEKIRNKYIKQEDKTEQLRRLDRSVTSAGRITSLSLGIIGCLIFGTGMCFCMEILPVTGALAMLLGLILGVIGTALMIIAYPIYKKMTEARKKKLAPEIIKLSNEILGQK